LSRGTALQGRHLAQGSQRRGQAHHDSPRDKAGPGPVREVVGEELRGQAVARVGRTGSDRDQDPGRLAEPRERIRDESDQGEDGDGNDQLRSSGMFGLTWGRGPGQKRDPRGHRAHAENLAPADPLPEHLGADPEQHDEAHRQRRLDQRERDQQERSDLSRPAAQGEAGADEPARLPDQPENERDAEMLLLGRLASLERLQANRRGIEDRGREGERETGNDVHGQGAR